MVTHSRQADLSGASSAPSMGLIRLLYSHKLDMYS